MDTMSWFKHPRDLSNDKRMSLLINREGGKGYGTYLYIIETLFMQADGKLNFCQLDTMSRKGFSRKCMERVIRDYKLFIIQGEEFESAISFGQTKTAQKTTSICRRIHRQLLGKRRTPGKRRTKARCRKMMAFR